MKKRTFALIIVAVVASLTAFKIKREPLEDVFVKINQEVLYRGRSYETLEVATSTIGHRLTGSTNGKKAEEFAYKLLKEYGFSDVKSCRLK